MPAEAPGAGTAPFSVDVIEQVEPDTLIFLKSDGLEIIVRALREVEELTPGSQVHVGFPEEARHFFHHETGERLP